MKKYFVITAVVLGFTDIVLAQSTPSPEARQVRLLCTLGEIKSESRGPALSHIPLTVSISHPQGIRAVATVVAESGLGYRTDAYILDESFRLLNFISVPGGSFFYLDAKNPNLPILGCRVDEF